MSTNKILMLINGSPFDSNGGLGVHTRYLCDELRKFGDIELTLLSADYYTQDGGLYLMGDKKRRVQPEDWKHEPNHYRLLEVYNTNQLLTRIGFLQKMITDDIFLENALAFLGQEKFDLIHLHDANLWGVAKHLRALYRCPVLMSCHLNLFLSHDRLPEDPFYLYDIQQEGSALYACNKLLTVSEYYKKTIQDEYWLEEKIEVVTNGVDYEFLRSIKYDEELKKKYDKPLVVFVGRMVPTKGVWLILEAVKQMPDHYFVLISALSPTLEPCNPLADEIKKMKERYTNFEWLNFCPQEDKWKLMKIAEIGIMPSLHEPFGITALEWMGLGVPLIVSNIGGLKEFCNDSNSTLIEPTAESLINAVRNHKADTEKLQNAKETAKRFSWKEIAQKTRDIYLSMR
jgi:glycosyltransferase involved in cell wall biosynthesis